MVIKHGDKAARPSWEYPDDLDGFLTLIGASPSDLKEAALRVDIFMHGHDAWCSGTPTTDSAEGTSGSRVELPTECSTRRYDSSRVKGPVLLLTPATWK